jgi:lysyl-tRNA synthetase class 2
MMLQAAKAQGLNPYPHKFVVSHTLPEFIKAFGSGADGQHDTSVTVSVAGAHTALLSWLCGGC